MWHNLSRVFEMEWSSASIRKWDEEVKKKKLDMMDGRMKKRYTDPRSSRTTTISPIISTCPTLQVIYQTVLEQPARSEVGSYR